MVFHYKKLGELVAIVGGGTPDRRKPHFWNGDINWISVKDLVDDSISSSLETITREGLEKSSAKLIPKGNIILPTRMALGKVAINQIDVAINQDLKALIIKDNSQLDLYYLFYFLKSKSSFIESKGKGATVKGITVSLISDLQIPLPPLTLQKKIASALGKAQELINKRKAQIEALDQLTQSVFLEMFGDPWINPKKWRVKKIKEVIKNKPINGFFAKNEQYSDKGNAKIIWISDFINKRSANIHGLKKVVATEEDIKKYQVKYGDILFCRSSLNVDGIGKAAYVPEFPKDENIIFECHIIKITLSDEVLPEFFQVLSETKFFRNQIIKHSKTSTMTTISQSGIMECSIIVPPVQIQNQFLQILKKIEYEKQKLQNSLSLLNDNFNSLMQQAFKGELFND